jgi:hypothetical protein
VQRATILGYAAATDAGTLVDVENGVLVAVKRHRFAIAFDIELRGLHVIERRLALNEPQKQQSTGRVIDIRQHRAVRATIFKPETL